MHEEPIVCSPADAVRAFLQGHLDGLAIGPFFVPHPERKPGVGSEASRKMTAASSR
jgi:hypothetical protein